MPSTTYKPVIGDRVKLNASNGYMIAKIIEVSHQYIKIETPNNSIFRYDPYQFDGTWNTENEMWDLSNARPRVRF